MTTLLSGRKSPAKTLEGDLENMQAILVKLEKAKNPWEEPRRHNLREFIKATEKAIEVKKGIPTAEEILKMSESELKKAFPEKKKSV